MNATTVTAMRSDHTRARTRAAGLLGALLLLWTAAAAAYDYNVFGDGVQLACWQREPTRLACDFRRFAPPEPEQVTARLAGRDLPAPRITAYVDEPGSTAVMFLVDVSDAELPVAPVAARNQVRTLLDAAPPHQHYGLASFANEVEMHAPLGAGVDRLRNVLGELTPGGESAELYRSALEAVRLLGHYPARRRALFLISDGLADDSAYFHDDVVDAARQYDVSIFGIGYLKSPALSTALQRLRRLAQATGGMYVTVDAGGGLPSGFASTAFAQLASGGRMDVDLAPALGGAVPPPQEAVLELHWRGAAGNASAHVPLRLSTTSAAGASTPAAGQPATRSSLPAAPVARRESAFDRYLVWIAGGTAALLVLALLAWLIRRRPREDRREPAWAETLELNARSFAYLEIQDELHTRHPVSGETFRIGRHADNALMLADASISRHHAEIKHELNSRYVIRDLESLNGVYVNGRKARTAILSNGDLIELGDVTLKFTVFAAHEGPELEGTADSTVTPFRPTDKKKGLRPL